jgi:uncharacterized protein YbjT (DUF2867 family)
MRFFFLFSVVTINAITSWCVLSSRAPSFYDHHERPNFPIHSDLLRISRYMFMQELLCQAGSIRGQGMFFFPFGRDVRINLVDVRDNAAVAAKALSERGHEGKTYDITGPAAPTFDEVADAISAAVGRKVSYVPVTMEQWKQGFATTGAPQWLVETVAELYKTFVPANSAVTDAVQRVTGRGAKAFGEFAKDFSGEFSKT